ncbi:YidC/Oxa1 family membrane protein insertase, partial [Blastococcus sp. URHD0036]|uniref:YidC/Oxa1 family membrane protein insertase n=1 Tax=Blastococcus sp. URHD0036 TaxID=1380356 RepID=UPI000497CB18
IFIALFHVLRRLQPGAEGLYSWSYELTQQAATAKLFGAPISASFTMKGDKREAILAIPGVTLTSIHVVALTLMIIMCITTFTTQRQIMKRSGPVEGQAAMIQKLMLYGMPVSLFVTGFFFPIGVLLYWFTNNLWTLMQQFYILRKMPPPNSPAALAKKAAEKPAVDPKALAPKPGAKPVRGKGGRPAVAAAAVPGTDSTGADAAGTDAGVSEASAGAAAVNGTSGSSGNGAAPPAAGSTGAGKRPGGAGSSAPGNRNRRKRR